MTINGNKIEFTTEHPKKAGTYLWNHSIGVDTIYVVLYPARAEYGLNWDEYLGIPSMRGKNVEKLLGQFCEICD
jgi:hypothetical protein